MTKKQLPLLNKLYKVDCLRFLKKLPDKSIDLVITDPPYNDLTMFRGGGLKGKVLCGNGWFKNDQIPEDVFNNFFEAVLQELHRVLKDHKHIYIFCNHKVQGRFKKMFVQRFNYVNLLVWDKVYFGMGYCYRQQYELVL